MSHLHIFAYISYVMYDRYQRGYNFESEEAWERFGDIRQEKIEGMSDIITFLLKMHKIIN